MAFANTGSIVANDMNNMLRGIHRDNTAQAHTGDTAETNLNTFSLTGGTLTSTGGIYIISAGTTTSTNSTKDIKLYFGSVLVPTLQVPQANTDDWLIEAWVFNTTTTAQKYITKAQRAVIAGGTVTFTGNMFGSSTEDTTANVTIKTTATLANGSDTITQTMFDVFIIQIT